SHAGNFPTVPLDTLANTHSFRETPMPSYGDPSTNSSSLDANGIAASNTNKKKRFAIPETDRNMESLSGKVFGRLINIYLFGGFIVLLTFTILIYIINT